MTISNQTSTTSAVGSGVDGQVVPFTFPILSDTDLIVKTVVTDTLAETTLSLNTDYTVSINQGGEGGSVTIADAVVSTSEIWILRSTPKTQELELTAGGHFSAARIEDALDKLTKLCIENANAIASTTGFAVGVSELDIRAYISDNILVHDGEVLTYEDEILLA